MAHLEALTNGCVFYDARPDAQALIDLILTDAKLWMVEGFKTLRWLVSVVG
jgi:hypothetical protein